MTGEINRGPFILWVVVIQRINYDTHNKLEGCQGDYTEWKKKATSKVYTMYGSNLGYILEMTKLQIRRTDSWCRGLRDTCGGTILSLDCFGGHTNLHM